MAGVPLLVVSGQEDAIPLLTRWAKPQDPFVAITLHDNVIVTAEDSRGLLRGLGIHGEIVPTPGHSDNSVSLLLDNGFVFSGDLPDPARATAESAAMVEHSWRVLRERGATTVYPGHGPVPGALAFFVCWFGSPCAPHPDAPPPRGLARRA